MGAAVVAVNAKEAVRRKYFERTGCLLTVDGSGDTLIRPDGLRSYAFDRAAAAASGGEAPAAPAAALPSGNQEIQAAVDELAMIDDDSECDDGDSDDEDDPVAIKSPLPKGYDADSAPTSISKCLEGRMISFLWNGAGWCSGKIKQVYPEGAKIDGKKTSWNALVEYKQDMSHHHTLSLTKVKTAGTMWGSKVGSWILLKKKETETVERGEETGRKGRVPKKRRMEEQ